MKVKASHQLRSVVPETEGDATLPPVGGEGVELRHILVPVDFSERSRKAFRYGIMLARQFNAEIMLLHVIVVLPPPPQMVIPESTRLSARDREEAEKLFAEWREEVVPGVSVKGVVNQAPAVDQEIVDAARELNSDLIVIGNHGRTGISRLLLGSTAERVVRHAPCPVLVIREQEHDFIQSETGHAA